MGYSYAGGEVFLIVLGSVFALIGVICLVYGFIDELEAIFWGLIVAAFGGILIWGGVSEAADRYQRLEAANDLRQNYGIVVGADDLDHDVDGRRQVEFSRGSCEFIAYVEHDDQLGRYVLVNGGARLTISDLACAS